MHSPPAGLTIPLDLNIKNKNNATQLQFLKISEKIHNFQMEIKYFLPFTNESQNKLEKFTNSKLGMQITSRNINSS